MGSAQSAQIMGYNCPAKNSIGQVQGSIFRKDGLTINNTLDSLPTKTKSKIKHKTIT